MPYAVADSAHKWLCHSADMLVTLWPNDAQAHPRAKVRSLGPFGHCPVENSAHNLNDQPDNSFYHINCDSRVFLRSHTQVMHAWCRHNAKESAALSVLRTRARCAHLWGGSMLAKR
jgi:hypothetical protein